MPKRTVLAKMKILVRYFCGTWDLDTCFFSQDDHQDVLAWVEGASRGNIHTCESTPAMEYPHWLDHMGTRVHQSESDLLVFGKELVLHSWTWRRAWIDHQKRVTRGLRLQVRR